MINKICFNKNGNIKIYNIIIFIIDFYVLREREEILLLGIKLMGG